MKKTFLFFVCAFILPLVYSADFSSSLEKSLIKILPKNKGPVIVGALTYGETESATEFTPYLRQKIETVLSENGYDIFSLNADRQAELFIAGLNESGVYKNLGDEWNDKELPLGTVSCVFVERGAVLELFLDFRPLAGNAKKSSFEISSQNLPGFNVKPANQNIVENLNDDFSKSNNSSGGIAIQAAMLDKDGNLVDVLYPDDIVRFMVHVDKDSYIAILCIDAAGQKSWLPIENNFVRAGQTRYFPDISDIDFRVLYGTYGSEQILIYASETAQGLPAQTNSGEYKNGDLQNITRAIGGIKKGSSVYKIGYAVLEKK